MYFKGIERALLTAIMALSLGASALPASLLPVSAASSAGPSPGAVLGAVLGEGLFILIFSVPLAALVRWALMKIVGHRVLYWKVLLGVCAFMMLWNTILAGYESSDAGQGFALFLLGMAMISSGLAVPVRWALTKFLGAEVTYGQVWLCVFALSTIPLLVIFAFESAMR